MRLATVRHEGRTSAARQVDGRLELLDAPDVGALLAAPGGWRAAGEARTVATVDAAGADYAPVVPAPRKIFCVGLNYRRHIEEMGHDAPGYPTLFAKFARALIGHGDEIALPPFSTCIDWEVELVVVIGSSVQDADEQAAAAAIAGFSVGNDVTARDFQRRTSQFLQGKTIEHTSPVGPVLVTADELGTAPDLAIRCFVDDVLRQDSRTADLLFKPTDLVAYISQIVTLEPGDLIFTGTPGGVGQGFDPPIYLAEGQTVRSSIEGIGELVNRCAPRQS